MFSKSLFKQSCKANGIMWTIITVAVCFMLACVMLIAGNGNIDGTKVTITNTIIKGEFESSMEKSGVNYYEISSSALEQFDTVFATNCEDIPKSPEFQNIYGTQGPDAAKAYLGSTAYTAAANSLNVYVETLSGKLGYKEDSTEKLELQAIVFGTLNITTGTTEQGVPIYKFDNIYSAEKETLPRYDLTAIATKQGAASTERADYREKYAMNNSSIILAYNMTQETSKNAIMTSLSNYGVTPEQYTEFKFDDYQNIKDMARSAVVNYRGNLEYRLDNKKEDESVEDIKAELKKDVSSSLLATLPSEVSDALEEIGKMDLYGILVGSIFFRMAGLLLPIIYMIMAANALIAGQVDSGSMAYTLSTSTKRKQVVFTQAVFLVGSLFAMFLCTTITSLICFHLVKVQTDLTIGKLLLINLGAFLVMFAMSGISFLASCWFNRSKSSMAIGGGLNMFFLVATMLGLFGSKLLPSIIRMNALNSFNYVSVITLFDVVSILDGTLTFLWKFAILIGIGLLCYIIGSIKFKKKDLPL